MARPKPENPGKPRSVRIPDNIWNGARARAKRENTTVTRVVADLMEGYARGVYDLPQTKVTKQFPTA